MISLAIYGEMHYIKYAITRINFVQTLRQHRVHKIRIAIVILQFFPVFVNELGIGITSFDH